MIDELHTLMNFFPVSHNQQAVAALLDLVEARLKQRGLVVERFEHGGIQNLYASTRGQKHSKVMLQSHVDVVPGGEMFRREGDRIYGRGCYDMLFAVVSFLNIIDNLETPASYDISILLTGDEEIGGVGGVQAALDEDGFTTEVCVLPDAGDGFGTMSIAAKGMYDFEARAVGRSHHGSRPWEGDNAAHKLIAFLTELQAAFDNTDQDASTITISQLQAGSEALNQGPAEATAGVDIRYVDDAERTRIVRILTALAKKYDVDITDKDFKRSFSVDIDDEIVKQFMDIYQDEFGSPIELTKAPGASDACYFDAKSMPVIMCRPDGGNAHSDTEWLSIASWKKFQDVLESYVLRVAKV